MQVRFWGVRGSCPSPLLSEDIVARLEEALRLLDRDPQSPDLSDPAAVARWINALPLSVRGTSGGNTPCVEMRTAEGDLFIIDLGSGARPLGTALMEEDFGRGQGHARIFLSHYHWDHIQGWPFFKPALSGRQSPRNPYPSRTPGNAAARSRKRRFSRRLCGTTCAPTSRFIR